MKEKEETYNSDITKDDLQALRPCTENTRSDGSDDRLLTDRTKDVDFAGKDLDIPGRTLPNAKTKSGMKDEENQLYSQGGTGNEGLEQNTDHIHNA